MVHLQLAQGVLRQLALRVQHLSQALQLVQEEWHQLLVEGWQEEQ